MLDNPFTAPFHSLTIRTSSEAETESLGEFLGRILRPGDVVALIGDLGSGKTVFTRGLVRGVDIQADIMVSSPSFTIVSQYATRIPVNHIDLFRLAEDDEFLVELEDYLTVDTITVIEWADRITVSDLAAWVLNFEWLPDDARRIRITASTGFGTRSENPDQ